MAANVPAYQDREPADGMTDSPDSMPSPGQIMLDKSNPDIAEAFANCKEGDMYKVVKDDENEVVLEMVPAEGDAENPAEDTAGDEPEGDGPDNGSDITSDKPAIAMLIAKKRKQ